MRISKAKSIEEFKKLQEQHVNKWISDNFVPGCISWTWQTANSIVIQDKTGDSMVINLDQIP